MAVVLGPRLAEGKTKIVYADPADEALAYIVSKDDITAGDGLKRDLLAGKGALSTRTTGNCFRLLNQAGIDTHLVEQVDEQTLRVRRCQMIPLEVVMRRIATGSYLKRQPEVAEGTRFDPPLVEYFFKDDARHDPLVTPPEMIEAGVATGEEMAAMAEAGIRVFTVLERAWAALDVVLVDLKIEFGRDQQGQLLVADVIDNDSWRIWPGGDKDAMLDKQLYRNMSEVTASGLAGLAERYQQVAALTDAFGRGA